MMLDCYVKTAYLLCEFHDSWELVGSHKLGDGFGRVFSIKYQFWFVELKADGKVNTWTKGTTKTINGSLVQLQVHISNTEHIA